MAESEAKEPDPPFLNTVEAAAWLRLTKNTLEKMRVQGRGPIYRKHGRYVRYHIEDLVDYSQEVFDRIVSEYSEFAEQIGLNAVTFIPISGVKGDNIVEPGPNTTQSGGRITLVTVASDTTLTTWTDPDAVSTSFGSRTTRQRPTPSLLTKGWESTIRSRTWMLPLITQ